MGKCYEIAPCPDRFQRDCAGDTTATCSLKPDGKVRLVSECRTAEGRNEFYGKYGILELGDNYEYAVIGEPSRKYFRILSLGPKLDDAMYQQWVKKIRSHGYDPSKLMETPQSDL